MATLTVTHTPSQNGAPDASSSLDPATLVITVPEVQDVTILTLDSGLLLDLRPVLNEPIIFSRVDGDLQMIFENGGTILIDGFFSGNGEDPIVLVGDDPTTLTLDQFVSIADIDSSQEIQTAADEPVTLGERVEQAEGSSPSLEDPGLAALGDGLGILDLLGPGDLLANEIFLPEEFLPGFDTDAEDANLLTSLDNGLEEPISEDPVDDEPVDEDPVDEEPVDEDPVDEDPVDEDPVDEDPVDAELVDDLPASNDLLLWLDQPNHGGWVPSHYRDIIEFEDLTVWIDGEPVDFSLVESLTEGVNESPEADEGDYALDGPDGRQLFLNLGDLGDLPDGGEIRIDFNFSNFDKRVNRPDYDAGGGVEDDPDTGGEGYRFGIQVGPPEGDDTLETVVDHTDNGINFHDEEAETPHDDDDAPRTIKFDYEVTEEGEVVITNVLTIFRGGLVLDLDDDGIEMDNSIQFDMDLDGTTEEVGWMGAGDGLLVMDLNNDGIINDASEVVGEHFQGGSTGIDDVGRYFAGAYEALIRLDINGDGVIDASDEAYQELRVWVDANGDGVTDDGELKTLADLGISSIDIDSFNEDQDSKYDESWEDVNDNIIDREGSFTRDDGSTGSIYDTRFWESEPNIQTGTSGEDTFVLDSLADANLILDYNFEEQDAIDIGQLLDNAFPPASDGSDADDFAMATRDANGNVILLVDPDGANGGQDWQEAATIQIDPQSMGDTVNLVMDTIDVDIAISAATV